MALEEKIDALVVALNANTAALTKIGAAAKPAAAAAAAKPAAAKVKLEDVQKAFAAYLGVTDEDERAARKAKMVQINAHFGVDRISNVDATKYAEALDVLKKVEAGEMFAEEPDADEALV